jgi:putative membrane protein
MSSAFAFLHHIAAFTLVAAMALEFVLVRGELSARSARQLLAIDAILGASAGVVLLAGLLRVFYFEKGGPYYFSNVAFIAKLSLFVAIALISIYPTIEFLSWRKAIREGRIPVVAEKKMRRIRSILHWELAGMVVLILCAVLMARGVGTLG